MPCRFPSFAGLPARRSCDLAHLCGTTGVRLSSGAAGSDPPITCESSKAPLLSDHAAPEAGLPIMSVHSDSKSKSCARRKMGASCPDHHHQGRRPCQPEHRIYPADRRAAPGLPDKSGVPSRNPVPAGPNAGGSRKIRLTHRLLRNDSCGCGAMSYSYFSMDHEDNWPPPASGPCTGRGHSGAAMVLLATCLLERTP